MGPVGAAGLLVGIAGTMGPQLAEPLSTKAGIGGYLVFAGAATVAVGAAVIHHITSGMSSEEKDFGEELAEVDRDLRELEKEYNPKGYIQGEIENIGRDLGVLEKQQREKAEQQAGQSGGNESK